jgi:hypothetical protein
MSVAARPASTAALVVAVIAAAFPVSAGASQIFDRNATQLKLQVDAKGEAMLTYDAGGKLKHLLAWGALNAIPPTQGKDQVAFSLDYSGGYGKYHQNDYWSTGSWSCAAYDGPTLAWSVAACKAPDGSYWAVQAWQRSLPDYGVDPSAEQSVMEFHLSHWTGALPVLTVATDWSYRRFDHLFGTLTYGGTGVYGFKSTSSGRPLDSFGRNIFVDSRDSDYGGTGWKRVNSFLTHKAGGSFCYGFFPHGGKGTGKGQEYRATVQGPGVAPDVMWQGAAPGAYDKAADTEANAAIAKLNDPLCRPN